MFDPSSVSDPATYEMPQQYAKGVPFVFVNGTAVIDNGSHTGARPGKIIYGPGKNGGRQNPGGLKGVGVFNLIYDLRTNKHFTQMNIR